MIYYTAKNWEPIGFDSEKTAQYPGRTYGFYRNKNTNEIKSIRVDSVEELIRIKNPHAGHVGVSSLKAGEKFGMLTVDGERKVDASGHPSWKCTCDCGNSCYIRADVLHNGQQTDCGCQHTPKGERKIQELLTRHGIDFIPHKTFGDLKAKRSLSYDIAVLDVNKKIQYLIEYDGDQHYKEISFFRGAEGLKYNKEHDHLKNKYCEINNIPLIRIPYKLRKPHQLTIEDILLETSTFIYNHLT